MASSEEECEWCEFEELHAAWRKVERCCHLERTGRPQ